MSLAPVLIFADSVEPDFCMAISPLEANTLKATSCEKPKKVKKIRTILDRTVFIE